MTEPANKLESTENGYAFANETQLRAKFSFLYSYVRGVMPHSLRRFVGASDIVQSVLVRVDQSKHEFHGTSDAQFRGWVIQIARRKIVDGIRRFRSAMRFESGICSPRDEDSSHVYQSQRPYDDVADAEQAEMLLNAIASLPLDIQRIVILRYSHDMTFEQISSEVNMAVTTCRRRWIEGCKMLRERLAPILNDKHD